MLELTPMGKRRTSPSGSPARKPVQDTGPDRRLDPRFVDSTDPVHWDLELIPEAHGSGIAKYVDRSRSVSVRAFVTRPVFSLFAPATLDIQQYGMQRASLRPPRGTGVRPSAGHGRKAYPTPQRVTINSASSASGSIFFRRRLICTKRSCRLLSPSSPYRWSRSCSYVSTWPL